MFKFKSCISEPWVAVYDAPEFLQSRHMEQIVVVKVVIALSLLVVALAFMSDTTAGSQRNVNSKAYGMESPNDSV